MLWFRKKRNKKASKASTTPPVIIKNPRKIGERDGIEIHHFQIEMNKPIRPGKLGRRIVTAEEWYANEVENEEIPDEPKILKFERVGVIDNKVIDYFKVQLSKPIPPAKKGFEIITPPPGMFD